MAGFEADPATLARHAAEFPGLADQAGAIHGELSAALAAAGPCWGGDAAGQNFADGHVQPADGTLARLAALPGQLTDVGDRFTATAANYQRVDEYGASLIGGGSGD
ncbi:MAG TPA: hypothetical protein VFX16_08845 [Pseudonocardiaceae bacterium]|nr:hypothetical protein [Pseudonocardiaceae bacterium]